MEESNKKLETGTSETKEESKGPDYHITLNSLGWYYDAQLNNELQSISLHANQKYSSKGVKSSAITDALGTYTGYDTNYEDWTNWSGKDEEEYDDDYYEPNFNDSSKGCGYRIKPICRALNYEDFVVNAVNSWSDFGSDVVGGIWDSMRLTAPFSSFLSGAYSKMADTMHSKYDSKGGKLASLITNGFELASKTMKNMSYYQNKSLVVTGTQMSLFSGTGIDFNNLGLRFTLFPELEKDGGYKTVTDQVKDLYPYFIGIYKPDTSLTDLFNKVKSKVGLDDVKIYDMSSYMGWNNPPGGYKANNHVLDSIHQGTLKLRIGGQYSIPNLVCQSATFSFSKQMVKLPGKDDKLEISPLYCDITIVLKPMSRFTNRVLTDYINGRNSQGTSGRKTQLDNKVNQNLQKLIKEEQKRQQGY